MESWNLLTVIIFSPSVRPPWASGTRGWLEVPGHHSHPGGEEEGEVQASLHQEEACDQADQAGREERGGQDCKIHRRS